MTCGSRSEYTVSLTCLNAFDTQAFLYGKGIFTTLAFSDAQPKLWEKHWLRLETNARRLGIDLSKMSDRSVREALDDSISESGLTEGRARISIFDQSASPLWPNATSEAGSHMRIMVGERRPISAPFRVTLSPYRVNSRSPLAGVKSCNYLEPLMSLDEARSRGFHEGIRLNEHGLVTGACMANIFWLNGGRLFTPSLSTGCLAGTTRELVLETLDCQEAEADAGELDRAEAVFLTSARLGVVQAGAHQRRTFEMIDHPIVRCGWNY